jgi:predicted DsbA family dithiol-disulfide isomerase
MRVEIWSDVVCPWCYIGKRKFEEALARYEGRDDVEIVYRPYQLDPKAPPGSATPVFEAYSRKFGGPEMAEKIIDNVTGAAAEVGLGFRMDRAVRANTLASHRLLRLAEHEYGLATQHDLKERLLAAYFVEGRNVGDHDTLVDIAEAAGIARDRAQALLDSDEGIAETRAEIAQANELDITAVPTFVFDGRWAIPGAQDPDLFLRAMRRVDELNAAEAAEAAAAGNACADEACEI